MRRIRIGYLSDGYPYQRNILNKVEDAEYVKVVDFFRLRYYGIRLLKKFNLFTSKPNAHYSDHSFYDFNLNNVDVLHFFNNFSYGKTPWISTFETITPRISLSGDPDNRVIRNKAVDRAIKAIRNESCKKVIAISECSANFQRELFSKYKFAQELEEKLCVVHPPQDLHVNSFDEKGINVIDDEISFLFVGTEFFRKGGMEALTVCERLRNKHGLPIKLTIVSSLAINDYATQATKSDYDLAKKLMDDNKEWVTHYDRHLDNKRVLELMKNHHVGLLPTIADTYGYSVLEMQANGCPVITTDIRALPEINDNEKGWLIKVPKTRLGDAYYFAKDSRRELSKIIMEQLENIILDIFDNSKMIIEKANKSIKNIEENHSPKKYGERLSRIYEEALKNL